MSEVLPTLPSPPTTILRVGRLAPLAWPTALATPAPRHHPAGTRPAPPREQRYCPPPWVSTGRGPWGVGRRAWAEERRTIAASLAPRSSAHALRPLPPRAVPPHALSA